MARRSRDRKRDDPGAAWTLRALAPLAAARADCDVVGTVMRRIRASEAIALVPRPSRVAWAASLMLGLSALVFLVATLAVLVAGGDQGLREVAHVFATMGRLAVLLGQLVISIAMDLGGAALALLRAAVEADAAVLRAAAIAAAAVGLLSIVLSSYVFASVRRASPAGGARGGVR